MKNLFESCVLIMVAISLCGTCRGDLIITLNGDSTGRPDEAVGDGDLSGVIRAAADVWEDIFASDTSIDEFELVINYRWGALSGGTLGLHSLVEEGTINGIHRETRANLTFDNSSPPAWYVDGTPTDHSEYTTFNESFMDLGGGFLTAERYFDGATGEAVGAFDLYSVALHEIGHALGLSSANDAFVAEARTEGDNTVEVENPLPFSGSVIQIESGSAHLNSTFFSRSLLVPSASRSVRRLPSDADILANAQISRFNSYRLTAVPEPNSCLVLTCMLGLLLKRKRYAVK